MTLECTSCRARYSIADSLIPAQGARIKCRKCGEIITIEAPVIELAPTDLEMIPPPRSAPPRPEPAPARQAPAAPRPAPKAAPEPEPVASTNSFELETMPPSAPSAAEVPPPDPGFERFGAPPSLGESEASPPVAAPSPRQAPPLPDFDATPPALRRDPPPALEPVSAPAFEPAAPAAPSLEFAPTTSHSPSAPAAAATTAGGAVPDGLGPEERARHEKARRLARVLASDIAIYNREKRDRGIKEGNLVAVLGYEIKKSWEIYKERVTPEFANATPYFRDALNEMLAEGKKIF